MMITEFKTCPKCKEEVAVFAHYGPVVTDIRMEQTFLGYSMHSTYVLIADWIYHSKCWQEIEDENKHLIGPGAITDFEDGQLLDF